MKIKLSKIDDDLLQFVSLRNKQIQIMDRVAVKNYGEKIFNKAKRLGLICSHMGSVYLFTNTSRLYVNHPDIPTKWLLNTKRWHSDKPLVQKVKTLDQNRFFDFDTTEVLLTSEEVAKRIESYHRSSVPGKTYLTLHAVVDIQLTHFKKFGTTPSEQSIFEAIEKAGFDRIKHAARMNEGYIIKT